jgi:hypothetical protein
VRLRTARSSNLPLATVLFVALTFWTVGLTGLLAAGRVSLWDAIYLLGVPWAALGAAIRPDWLLLVLVALPASVTAVVQSSRLLILVAIALAAMLLTRPTFALGLSTGIASLIVIAVAGYVFQADVGAEARYINQSLMMLIIYYVLLTLVAFNLAMLGELDGVRLGKAFVLCVATTALLGFAGYQSTWFPGGPAIVTHTYLGYLAVGGLGVGFAALLMAERNRRVMIGRVATLALLSLTILSLGRAVWIAAAITFVLLVVRSDRRSYVLIPILAILLALALPAGRQELASSEGGDIAETFRTGEITTGRWELWTQLWDRAMPALPWGNGFGYTWSLSSEELFGSEGDFTQGEDGSVHPHNDFLFLFVEFGLPGVLLLAYFWVSVLGAYFRLERSPDQFLRFNGRVLLGILMTGFLMALVDNLFGIRPFAERFFPVAGVMLAFGQMELARRRMSSTAYTPIPPPATRRGTVDAG